MSKGKKLTNEVGAPIADNENSIDSRTQRSRGNADVWLLEKMAHFNREVIPERRMHAKGWGAHGNLVAALSSVYIVKTNKHLGNKL